MSKNDIVFSVLQFDCETNVTGTTSGCVWYLDKSYSVVNECLNSKASQCYTAPEINFGQRILQCK